MMRMTIVASTNATTNSTILLVSMFETSYDSKCGDPPVKTGHLSSKTS